MERPNSTPNQTGSRESLSKEETPDAAVSLFLRLWSYGGPAQPPIGLVLQQDPEVGTIIHEIVREGSGQIAACEPELWTAHFADAAHALATAKALQQRFLTFHRKTEPQQLVPSILIYPTKSEKPARADAASPSDMLANVTSAQILIAESIYEQGKNVPGLKFNSKPVREAGETFGPEAIYELLWTDESTYGHLRQASRAGLKTVGRYQVHEAIGRGAMGSVYKAYDELIGRTIALKTIPIDRNAPNRDELIERLKQEAKAAGGLDHPNIITIYDVGQEDDVVYLSMQYVKGTTLAAMLADVGVPSLATFLSWADQICAAVGFAHASGVIHRDLKPANLMVTEDGLIKILDFGIAKLENTSLTQTGLVVGTPSYMAPEQLAGKKIDHRADIFSLGSVFYELVTRERPFHGDVTSILYKIVHEDPVAPSLINPAIPGGIDAVIRKALSKDPKERFQSCEEMRKALAEQAARLHVSPVAVGPVASSVVQSNPQPAAPPPKVLVTDSVPKRRAVWPIVFVLLFVATAGWAYYMHSKTGSSGFFKQLLGKAQPLQRPEQNSRSEDPDREKSTAGSASNSVESAPSSTGDPGTGSAPNSENSEPVPVTAKDESGTVTIPASSAPGTQPASPPASASSAAATIPAISTATGNAATPAPLNPVSNAGASPTLESGTRSPLSPAVRDSQPDPNATSQPALAPLRQRPLMVDGFTKKNVPELLRVADIAARRGDYRLARYEYSLILRLDQNNLRARAGLRLIQNAEKLH